MLNSNGTLRIRTYTAGGALPVSGSVVRIFGADENNKDIVYSLITDRDGATVAVTLPAPDPNFSLSPTSDEIPYSLYDIEVNAPGYFSKKIYGVSIFSGTDAIQAIPMIPEGVGDNQNYPLGSVNIIIPNNQRLE